MGEAGGGGKNSVVKHSSSQSNANYIKLCHNLNKNNL